MGYVLDDGWDNCGPVARAGNAAFGVYVRCGIWVARNLTDGFIPGEIVSAYGSPELARKLVDVGLWEAVDGGYLAVDYLTLNATAEKVKARRKSESERKARYREKVSEQAKARKTAGKHSPRGTGRGTPTGQDAGRDAGVTGSLTSPKGEGDARPASQGAAGVPHLASAPLDEEDLNPVDWRTQKAYGTPPDPEIAATARFGAARASAAIRSKPVPRDESPDAHQRLLSLVPDPPTDLERP